ncbi:hypothetical protein PIROE2DRAFT_14157 [Piromyces sp. E2]|nr:hypothetical protein PIROE2DRAFT_14157 [Piromyces sp. E2]|eukprot:OUM60166.1 hypothetical protein PIROE2DRAFT_14157 [Piromyces sp. E2]
MNILKILPSTGICATQQIQCFIKWRKSKCIIRNFVRDILIMYYYSWTKERNCLHKKL